ncbi:MAG: (Fe-S)-binding protein [Methanomassiliicoccales archaeon]
MPDIDRELLACLQCGYCVKVCPAYSQTPWESCTPRGKVYYLTQLANRSPMDRLLGRKVDIDPEFVDAIFKCTGCGRCHEVCHVGIEFAEFWEKIREWLVEQGAGPKKAHQKIDERISKIRNPYGEDMESRDDWFPEEVPRSEHPEVIFFAGCTGSYRTKSIARSSVRVLHRAGVAVNVLGPDEWCCTSPALRTGQTGNTLECAEHIITSTETRGAPTMVTSCAGCFKTITTDFERYYARPSFEVKHFTEYVLELIKKKKLKFTKELNARVTYHDPCHLGRHSGVYEPPREIIKKMPGVDFVEMAHNREDAICCGAGGGYKSGYNEYATNIAAERVKEALDVGAEIIATPCPFCVLNLKHGAEQIGADIRIMDVAELVDELTEPEEEMTGTVKGGEPVEERAE